MTLLKNVQHELVHNGNILFTVTTPANNRLTTLESIDRRRFEIVRLLLEAGGNVNSDSKRDLRHQISAPIHLIGSNVDVLKLLIAPPYCADVLRRGWDGRTAACSGAEGSAKCVEILVDHHCTLMIDTARLVTTTASEDKKERTKRARAYSPRDYSLNDLADTERLTPLHCALLESHIEAAGCLLNAGASVNSLDPLYEAENCCQNRQTLSESVRTLLLDFGANV